MKTFFAILILSFTFHAGAESSNSIDREAVRQVIRKNLSSFRKCYSDELKNSPEISGKVVLTWDIADTGDVKVASIKSTSMNSPKVEECLVSTVKTLKFPNAPKDNVANINYPFVFGKNK